MAIRKRGDGRYQVRVRPFPEQTYPTKDAAETAELDLKLQKKLGRLYRPDAHTLGQELDQHEDRRVALGGHQGKLRPATVRHLAECKRPWEPLRATLLPALRRVDVEDHIVRRARAAPVAARNELQFLKAALREAESRGQDVDHGIFQIRAIRTEAAEGVALELDQVHAIDAHMPDRVGRIVTLCGTLGLRWAEAVNLDERMLKLDDAQLVIPRALNKSRREKPVPLARVEVQLLREQLMARPAGTRIVFPNAAGTVYSKSGFRSVWVPALEAAGLEGFRFHWLRHTAISLMARAGMKPELIAERVGHSDGGGLIYRRYRHLFPSEVKAAVSLVDAFVRAETERVREVASGQ